jgi:NAD(P)-dependent dehydrogenase (short-subunit alcohol dehydrogenase family)
MSDLTGKVAVVTGASTERGIGSSIALKLASAGASVYLVAEGTEAGLRRVQQACSALPRAGRILYGVFDLSQRGVPEKMIQTAAAVFERIDVLVNVAGIRAALDFEQYTRDDFEKVVAVNLAAKALPAPEFQPQGARRGGNLGLKFVGG